MNCKIFEEWLEKSAGSLKESFPPEEILEHLSGCESCMKTASDYDKLGAMLKKAAAPDPGEKFWDEYLTTVMDSVRDNKAAGAAAAPLFWVKRALIPAISFMVILFAVFQYGDFYQEEAEEDYIYSMTLDFILEEHDMIMAEDIFDPTFVYAVEEIRPEDLESSQVIKN